MKQLCIVVPCYNEEKRWNANYWNTVTSKETVDWLFVDDGSTDATVSKIEHLLTRENVSLLRLNRNFGKATAVREGLQFSNESREYFSLGFLDADAAVSAPAIDVFIEKWAQLSAKYDMLWASRVKLAGRSVNRNGFRHFLGRVVATALSWGTDLPYDTQCGFKIFRNSKSFQSAINMNIETRWFVDLEILINYKKIEPTVKIWEEPLEYWQEIPGSKIKAHHIPAIVSELLRVKTKLLKLSQQPPA
jgi:glycosyltransferase involved in cell wall biosynthesis